MSIINVHLQIYLAFVLINVSQEVGRRQSKISCRQISNRTSICYLSTINVIEHYNLDQCSQGTRKRCFRHLLLITSFEWRYGHNIHNILKVHFDIYRLHSISPDHSDSQCIFVCVLVQMHGLAFMISFINLLRASSLYNERETFTLLFVLVGCPFLLLTAISRIISLGIIVAFLDVTWVAILGLG